MVQPHQFIFTPGEWIGQGRLTFTALSAQLRFYTKWLINASEQGVIRANQLIEQQGEQDIMANSFNFSNITSKAFDVSISNELLGSANGRGIIDAKTIAWEFPRNLNKEREDNFEGFEVYEIQENGDYLLHAEYCSEEAYRTIIDGRIWKKT